MQTTAIIYNPVAGRGRARKLVESTRQWAAPSAELVPTAYPGHAAELAERLAGQGAERIIAAGGDGTIHEVANGILRGGNPRVVLGIWPLGSANDYAASLGLSGWLKARGTLPVTPVQVDVGRITGGGKERYTVNCLGFGFNGMVALESRKIRRLRGMPLYTLAFLRAMLWRFETPHVRIVWDERVLDGPTLCASTNIGIREGGFSVTREAILTDGLFDCLRVGQLKRWQLLRYLPGLMSGRLPTTHPQLQLGRASRVRIVSEKAMCVHADGEFFCTPDENIRGMQVEMIPRRLIVETGTSITSDLTRQADDR